MSNIVREKNILHKVQDSKEKKYNMTIFSYVKFFHFDTKLNQLYKYK